MNTEREQTERPSDARELIERLRDALVEHGRCDVTKEKTCSRCTTLEDADAHLASTAHVSGWQPIATAPRDGTKIIAYRPVYDGTYIPKVGIDYWKDFSGFQTWAKSRADTPPTQWQPLPAPPAQASEGGEGG